MKLATRLVLFLFLLPLSALADDVFSSRDPDPQQNLNASQNGVPERAVPSNRPHLNQAAGGGDRNLPDPDQEQAPTFMTQSATPEAHTDQAQNGPAVPPAAPSTPPSLASDNKDDVIALAKEAHNPDIDAYLAQNAGNINDRVLTEKLADIGYLKKQSNGQFALNESYDPSHPQKAQDPEPEAKSVPTADNAFSSGLKKQIEQAAKNHGNALSGFRCVYGGFFEKNSDKCHSVSSFLRGSGIKPADIQSRVVHLKLKQKNGQIRDVQADLGKINCPGKGSSNGPLETSLCQPLRFGLQTVGSKGYGICVPPGKNASLACERKVSQTSKYVRNSSAWAKAILKGNPKLAQQYANDQVYLCKNGAFTGDDSEIKATFNKTDVNATCKILNTRTAALKLSPVDDGSEPAPRDSAVAAKASVAPSVGPSAAAAAAN